MEKKPLYTIGHGNRKPEDFLFLLKEFSIEYLIDVRSLPYSKFNPKFNQNDFKFFLERNGIKYVFMGDSIGGRPKDTSCYDDDGKVDYEKVKTKDFFLQGIDRLKTAYNKGVNVMLMCSEGKPCECHRSKLIGRVLNTDNIILKHIDEIGRIKDQITVINELHKGLSEYGDLFGNSINATSRKNYL
ncbi:MAG: DUF488 domain-containing protein [Bacteroidia bacterium]